MASHIALNLGSWKGKEESMAPVDKCLRKFRPDMQHHIAFRCSEESVDFKMAALSTSDGSEDAAR